MSANKSSKAKVPTKLHSGKYSIVKKLGAGCFGEVYQATYKDENSQEQSVAVKFEDASNGAPQLEHEAEILNVLRNPVLPQGIPEVHWFGLEGSFRAMVIDLLGRSLEDRVKGCNGKFTPKTTILVADQILRRIEYLHSKGIIHRDIKPENFMWGVKEKQHHLYLIDYGLSKRYFEGGKHIAMRQKLSLTGTARYASINAHRGLEQSRRDDIEAIGHMLLYFLRGALPWSGLEAKSKQEKYRKIKEKKESVPLPELCQGFPQAFESYLSTAREMGYKDRPNYSKLRELFAVAEERGNAEDHSFQWFEGKDLGALVPLQKVDLVQPDDQPVKPKGKGGGWCFCGGSKVKE